MPNKEKHCKISEEHTGEKFEELHEWMDATQIVLGINHRCERHSTIYLQYIMKKWNKEGVKEFLNHIIDDYKDTLRKYSGKCEDCGKDTLKGMKLCKPCWLKRKGG